jgi:hypothetical protein
MSSGLESSCLESPCLDSLRSGNVSSEFKKVIKEFVNDIINTFPEYKGLIYKWYTEENNEITDESSTYIFNYCVTVYPERFFEILYQNNDLFSSESKLNTEFLPGISFRYLWSCNISDTTRETIWKYLQLILISLIGSIKDKSLFGETSKLLDNINEDEFKNKLEETLNNIQKLFSKAKVDNVEKTDNDFQLPTSDDLHSHLHTMLHGKLGGLAKEIAEETVGNFNIGDMNIDTNDPQDIFKKLFAEPDKLMNLVKTVGSKLDSKMKSGDINQSELLSEATDMIQNMKNIPGMGNIQEMMEKMGMGLGKNAKVNKPAMENKLKLHNKRQALRKKMEEKHMTKMLNEAAQELIQQNNKEQPKMSDDELVSLFNKKDKKIKKKKESLDTMDL